MHGAKIKGMLATNYGVGTKQNYKRKNTYKLEIKLSNYCTKFKANLQNKKCINYKFYIWWF